MAARMLQRRVGSLFFPNQQPYAYLLKEQVVPSAYTVFRKYEFDKRSFQTETKPTSLADEDLDNVSSHLNTINSDSVKVSAASNLKINEDLDNVSSHLNTINSDSVKVSAASNLKISPRHDLALIFTCNVCETRSMKTVCRESYEKGVVVARCGGCNNNHLIADHLGWFGEPGSVEDFLAARGEEVKKGSADTLNLTLEDLAGMKNGKSSI